MAIRRSNKQLGEWIQPRRREELQKRRAILAVKATTVWPKQTDLGLIFLQILVFSLKTQSELRCGQNGHVGETKSGGSRQAAAVKLSHENRLGFTKSMDDTSETIHPPPQEKCHWDFWKKGSPHD